MEECVAGLMPHAREQTTKGSEDHKESERAGTISAAVTAVSPVWDSVRIQQVLSKGLSTGDKGGSEAAAQTGGRKEQTGVVCRRASATGGLEGAPHLGLNS